MWDLPEAVVPFVGCVWSGNAHDRCCSDEPPTVAAQQTALRNIVGKDSDDSRGCRRTWGGQASGGVSCKRLPPEMRTSKYKHCARPGTNAIFAYCSKKGFSPPDPSLDICTGCKKQMTRRKNDMEEIRHYLSNKGLLFALQGLFVRK